MMTTKSKRTVPSRDAMKTEGASDNKLTEGVTQRSFYQLLPVHLSLYHNAQHKGAFSQMKGDSRIDT